MSKQAVLILCGGTSAPHTAAIAAIAQIIADAVGDDIENVKIKHFDEDSLAKIILRHNVDIKVQDCGKSDISPVEQAVIFLFEKYKPHLLANSVLGFSFALQRDVCDARGRGALNPTFSSKEDDALLEAIDIIKINNVPTPLSVKYHFTRDIVDAIRYVANNT